MTVNLIDILLDLSGIEVLNQFGLLDSKREEKLKEKLLNKLNLEELKMGMFGK